MDNFSTTTGTLDQADEDTLSYTVSDDDDDALELADEGLRALMSDSPTEFPV
jgi:hypothetical protein